MILMKIEDVAVSVHKFANVCKEKMVHVYV